MIEWTVGADDDGARVDAWLSRRPEIGSRGRARAWIERGKIFLDGGELTFEDVGRRLRAGDRVGFWEDRPGSARRAPRELVAARGDLRVVFEDAALLVADKPVGLLVEPLPAGAPEEITLLDLVGEHLRSAPRLRAFVVHRIDRDTSGLVVFAKTPEAFATLKRQFERRSPERVYLAVVRGHLRPAAGAWSDRLAWDKDRLVQRRAHPDDTRAQQAEARYRVVEAFATASLVEVTLVTGRRNQIRVQAGLRGHPIVGERLYLFGAAPPPAGEPTLDRQALHAVRLVFRHPTGGRPVSVESPMPEDLADLVARLRTVAPAGPPYPGRTPRPARRRAR